MLYHLSKMAEFEPDPNRPLRVIGRYALYGQLASGGMATVHFGRLLGPVGFSRTVAIKRLHPQFSKDPEFVAMFLDEARLAARIQHPNVVATVDVVAMDEELFLVMDYIRGESFSRLVRGAKRKGFDLPEGLIANVVACLLHGLHAAHDATDERGQPLKVVHRDVSPQNILVGTDGVARVLDFGVAKAAARIQVTRDGQMKGKLAYMSPEQLSGVSVDRRSDVFAAGIVLWEALTGERLFTGEDASEVLGKILHEPVPLPSSVNPKVRREIDPVVMKALDKNPATRFQTAREFAIAVEETMQLMSPRAVGEWVERIAGESLEKRERALAEIESISSVNELASSLTPSEPGFMKTLKTQVRDGSPLLHLRPAGSAPPPLKRPPKPVSDDVDGDDAATRIYRPGAGQPLPAAELAGEAPTVPPPFGTPPPSPAVIVSEPPPYLPSAETGIEDNPFKRRSGWGPYALWAGGGMMVVGVAYVVISLLSSTAEPGLAPQLAATPKQATAAPRAIEEKPVKVVDPADLPVAESEPVTEAPPPTPKPPKTTTKPSQVNEGKKPAPKKSQGSSRDCAQPWFVDKDGIRRIKAECL